MPPRGVQRGGVGVVVVVVVVVGLLQAALLP